MVTWFYISAIKICKGFTLDNVIFFKCISILFHWLAPCPHDAIYCLISQQTGQLKVSKYSYHYALHWRHNGRDDVSNHLPHDYLLNRLSRRRSKKASKLRVTGLCAGNWPVTGEIPAQMACNAENASIWWRHHYVLQDSADVSGLIVLHVVTNYPIMLFICLLAAKFRFICADHWAILSNGCPQMPPQAAKFIMSIVIYATLGPRSYYHFWAVAITLVFDYHSQGPLKLRYYHPALSVTRISKPFFK